jgi:glutathione synthase
MKLLFILDPLPSIRTYKDSSYAMMVEAARRGHEIHFTPQEGLMWKDGKVLAEHCRLHLVEPEKRLGNPEIHDEHWYRLDLPPRATPLAEFDAVLMRKDPPFDGEYLTSTWLLEHAVRQGARVFNDPRALRDHNEKFTIAQFAQFAAPTLVTRLAPQLQAFIDTHGDVVLKPLEGMGGSQVFRVTDRDPNRNVIIETLTAHGQRTIMAQRYLPEIRDGDKRVLLIDGKPVPYVLARIPKAGESRGNLAAGGTGVARPLTSAQNSRSADCCSSASTSSATISRRSMSRARRASRRLPSRRASTSRGCSSMRSRMRWSGEGLDARARRTQRIAKIEEAATAGAAFRGMDAWIRREGGTHIRPPRNAIRYPCSIPLRPFAIFAPLRWLKCVADDRS